MGYVKAKLMKKINIWKYILIRRTHPPCPLALHVRRGDMGDSMLKLDVALLIGK